jgi:bifunctional polynucleotide phosphatase/kinase
MEYVLLIGVALSGKTTYRKANFPDHKVIALSFFDNNRNEEMKVIEESLKDGRNIVVDDTNLTRKIRKIHLDMAKKYHAKIVGIFMNTSANLLQQRQMRRRNPFPMAAINKQLKEFETPLKDEGFDTLIIKKDYVEPRST